MQGRRAEADCKELGCTLSQFALAWCLRSIYQHGHHWRKPREQVRENMKASDVVDKITPGDRERIDGISM